MIALSGLKHGFKKLGICERPRAERRSAIGLGAKYGLDSTFTSAGIKDISTSGIYLITEKRLRTNELITLILHEKCEQENSSELQFSVHARVTRQGEDGIGLSFVLPPGLDTNLWAVLVRNIVTLTRADQIADMFRALRTILFLCRLCHSEAGEAILLLGWQLADERVETIIKIALTAENMLASEPDFDRRRAHPRLVANILREGSWAHNELTIQLWAGLLASSCLVDESDNSNQVFVNLLTNIAPGQVRIFTYACEQALCAAQGAENSSASSVVITPEEMIELTSVSELSRNATSVAYLFNLGVVQKLPDLASYLPHEEFDITPTSMGLELYKHCHGDRSKVDRALVLTAHRHLHNLFPRPINRNSQEIQAGIAALTEARNFQAHGVPCDVR